MSTFLILDEKFEFSMQSKPESHGDLKKHTISIEVLKLCVLHKCSLLKTDMRIKQPNKHIIGLEIAADYEPLYQKSLTHHLGPKLEDKISFR